MVSIDGSLFAEIGIIILMIFILNRLLYRPLLSTLEDRRKRLENEQNHFESIRSAGLSIETEITETLRIARETAQKNIQDAVIEMERSNRKKISETREKTEKRLAENHQNVQKTVETTQKSLQSEITNLTGTFIAKIMPVFLVIYLLTGTLCLASETQHSEAVHPSSESHEGGISELARAVDFVAMAALLTYLLRKKVTAVLSGRILSIKSSLASSKQRIETAEKQLEEAKIRKKSIETELQTIAAEGKTREQKLIAKLTSQANLMIDKINRDTEMLIEAEINEAQAAIQQFIVDQSISNVRAHFSSGLDIQTDQRLIECFLSDFDQVYRMNEGPPNA
jgi:F-type H+-transporting ATPase subunit b